MKDKKKPQSIIDSILISDNQITSPPQLKVVKVEPEPIKEPIDYSKIEGFEDIRLEFSEDAKKSIEVIKKIAEKSSEFVDDIITWADTADDPKVYKECLDSLTKITQLNKSFLMMIKAPRNQKTIISKLTDEADKIASEEHTFTTLDILKMAKENNNGEGE